MDVLISIGADVYKMGTRAFRGADVLAPGCARLETIWGSGSEAQLVECLLEQKGCTLEWDAGIRSL